MRRNAQNKDEDEGDNLKLKKSKKQKHLISIAFDDGDQDDAGREVFDDDDEVAQEDFDHESAVDDSVVISDEGSDDKLK